ncbi:vacuolar protein sorting-associated protein 13 [Tetranychus urticae]|uniref:Vacuolar protein sorting-associated protein 13A n=1 Tax=Tetranychus urticae TaxID=32264 RepID=T1JZV2_TETUR|nr:vacuolar protein sorting-associated protein 13 [Tetranychus urticae]
MVFESLTSNLLNTYLNEFIDDLSANQLKIGAFTGDVELKNLAIKGNAFDSLNLPFRVVYGHIGKFKARVPWVSLYTSPVVFTVSDVFIVCVPNVESKYDAEVEKKQMDAEKKKQLKQIEEAMKTAQIKESDGEQAQGDDFVTKLVAQIMRNLEIQVDNVHICYEDKFTNPKSPFSIGLTLSRLAFVTSQETCTKYTSSNQENSFLKEISLEYLSVYWNCSEDMKFISDLKEEDMDREFMWRIASKWNRPKDLTYVLRPNNFTAKTFINRKPKEEDFKVPMFDIDMLLDQFTLAFNRGQFESFLLLLDSVDRMKLAAPYRQWRPHLPIKGNARVWWKFVQTAILETEIRQRNRVWSWSYIKAHRQLMKEYEETYRKHLLTPKKVKQGLIDELESKLDVFNIILVRSQVDLGIEKMQAEKAEETKSGGWLSWVWGSSKKDDEGSLTKPILDEIKKEMTSDEKGKLYAAIGYEESVPAEYPPFYEAYLVAIKLRAIQICIFDEKKEANIISFGLNDVATQLGYRPSSNGVRVGTTVRAIDLKGVGENQLVTNQVCDQDLLEIILETNPLDASFDYGATIKARGVDVMYHAQTFNALFDIITPQEDVSLDQIQALAEIKFNQFKLMSVTGLEYAIEKHNTLKIDIVIEPSYIVIPDRGCVNDCENVLILSCGEVAVFSEFTDDSTSSLRLKYQDSGEEALINAVRESAYERFRLKVSRTQIILTTGENWRNDLAESRTQTTPSVNNLLEPFGLELCLMRSIIADDPHMPQMRIEGTIPSIFFKARNIQLCRLFNLLLTVPTPKKSETMHIGPKIESNEVHEAKATTDALKIAQETAKLEARSSKIQMTHLVLNFKVESLTCDLQTDHGVELLLLRVKRVGTEIFVKSFDTVVDLFLGQILVQVHDLDVAGSPVFKLIETIENENLLQLKYKSTLKNGPTFEDVIQSIDIQMSQCKLFIDSPILDELLLYTQKIANSLPSTNDDVDRALTRRRPSVSSQISTTILAGIMVKPKKKHAEMCKVINLRTKICVDSVVLAIGGICSTTLKGLEAILTIYETGRLNMKAFWNDFAILNCVRDPSNPRLLDRKLVHEHILVSPGKRVLELELTMFTPTETKYSPGNVDMQLNVQFGRLKIVFLNEFVVRLMNFLAVFETAKKRAIAASSAAAGFAKQTALDAYQNATKIGLNVVLEAPLIVIPRNWESKHCILVDLGRIGISNRIESTHSNLLDHIKCELTNTHVFMSTDDREDNIDSIVKPISFNLSAIRNLNFEGNKQIPELKLSATLEEIYCQISQTNLMLMMSILNENVSAGYEINQPVGEDVTCSAIVPTAAEPRTKKIKTKKLHPSYTEVSLPLSTTTIVEEAVVHVDAIEEEKVSEQIFSRYQVSFAMPKVDLVLYQEEVKSVQNKLTNAYLAGFDVNCEMNTDDSLTLTMTMSDIVLCDERPSKNKRLRKLMYCNDYISTSNGSQGKTLKIYFKKEKDTIVNMEMSGFTLIFALDYLLQLSNIVTSSLQGLPSDSANAVSTDFQSLTASTREGIKARVAELSPDKMYISRPIDTPLMTIRFTMSEADIVLIESTEMENPPAVIFNSLMDFDVKMKDDVMSLKGSIGHIQLGITSLENYQKTKKVDNYIVRPFEIYLIAEMNGSSSQHIDIDFTDIGLFISPNTIQILMSIMSALGQSSEEKSDDQDEDKLREELAIFLPKPLSAVTKYSFLHYSVAPAIEATEDLTFDEPDSKKVDFILQQLVVKVKNISITIESGGMDSQPLIKLISSHTIILDNWNKLNMNSSCYMDYYNEKTFAWEPIIETIDTEPWFFDLKAKIVSEEGANSRISAFLESKSQLEMTLSKSAISVITDLGQAFTNVVKQPDTSLLGQNLIEFSNFTGMDLSIVVDTRKFVHDLPDAIKMADYHEKIEIKNGQVAKLNNLRETAFDHDNEVVCELSHKGQTITRRFSLRGTERKCFRFPLLSYPGDEYRWMFDIGHRDSRTKRVIFGSTVEITNHFHIPLRLYYIDISGNMEEYTFLYQIEPSASYFLPVDIVYSKYQCIFVKPSDDYCTPRDAICWKAKEVKAFTHFFSTITCESKKKEPDFFIRVGCKTENVLFEDTQRSAPDCFCYKFNIYPVLKLRNLLPFSISYSLEFPDEQSPKEGTIKPGEAHNLSNLNMKTNKIVIVLNDYRGKKWVCRNKFPVRWMKEDQIEIFSFTQIDPIESGSVPTLDLAFNFCNSDEIGCRVASLFAPFWMLNKTGIPLTYKIGDNLTIHPPEQQVPVLLCFKPKTLFSKKKLSLAFGDSKFSDSFSIDAVGNKGNVIAKGKDKLNYCASIEIELSSFGFTKIVTVSPFYSIVNKSNLDLEISEDDEEWIVVQSRSTRSLWPKTSKECSLFFRLPGHQAESSRPISLKDSVSILLRVSDRLVVVNVDITDNSVVIQLTNYFPGSAPVRIFNTLEDLSVDFGQNLVSYRKRIPPLHCTYFTWHDPSISPLSLIWSTQSSEEVVIDLAHDAIGESEQGDIYWACFLYGKQRILLITRDQLLAQSTLKQTEFIKPLFDVEILLRGIGISLVNNDNLKEIAYIGITSSDILWEVRKQRGKRFKPLSVKQIEALENAYQKFLRRDEISGALKIPKSEHKSNIFLVETLKVDFSDIENMRLLEPYKGFLRRNSASGIWCTVSISEHIIQFHSKINRIQIDNQMNDCIFGIVMCPITPPRSLAIDRAPKAFFEVSTVIQKQLNMFRFNFIQVLIQEFLIQIDGDFLIALTELVSLQRKRSISFEKMIQDTMKKCLEDTTDYTEIPVSSKNYYDSIHFSPIKVHVSFNLGDADSFQLFGVFDFLIKSAGVTLTEFKDVLFKIDYFERRNILLSDSELIYLAIGHYVRQVLKQFYVVVLGLDVIGNPVGLFLGLKQGVGDFFYEPFVGIIEGPEEFAEGLAIGVRSLVSHTVGGAAGALGKITGTLGDGISTLTMDQEARRKRRERINKKQSFAQSSKDLARGFFTGITGVVTKPMKGAQQEGFEGLVKGFGRGVVGIIADPATGVIDFTSGSLNALQRAVDINAEAEKQRPTRHFHIDGVLRPYNRHEAIGKSILRDVDKGRFASTDNYVAHCHLTPETVLLITDNRVMYLKQSFLSKCLDLEWHEAYDNVAQVEVVDGTNILITLKEHKRKLGGLMSGEGTHLIHCPKADIAKALSQKIINVKKSGP